MTLEEESGLFQAQFKYYQFKELQEVKWLYYREQKEAWCWKEKQLRGQRGLFKSFYGVCAFPKGQGSLSTHSITPRIECISEYECLLVDFALQWIGKILGKEAHAWSQSFQV